MGPRNDYATALRALERLALVDLQDWWEAANRYKRNPKDVISFLEDPFHTLVARYGEQAAVSAVDFLILSRSLDDELRWLPTPSMAEVAAFEQARKSLSWAINTSVKEGRLHDQLARKKLEGVLNRLVLQPGRDTVFETTRRDGTGYARIPEPGACPFCLMLASRGAVYTKDTVLQAKSLHKYHDHCRCLGIEVRISGKGDLGFDRLPPVNGQLRQLWDTNVGEKSGTYKDSASAQARWRSMVLHMRRVKTGSDEPVRFPPIPGIKVPEYTERANFTVFGRMEPLPSLERMPGHVLFGWTDKDPLPPVGEGVVDSREVHSRSDRQGHRRGAIRKGATLFPEDWSDQKIVDAVRDTIENPDWYRDPQSNENGRRVRKEVDGVVIEVRWHLDEGEAVFDMAYPLYGAGVVRVDSAGKLVEVAVPKRKNRGFNPVSRE